MFTRTAKTTAVLGTAVLFITACGDGAEDTEGGDNGDEQETYTIGVANEHEAHQELARIAEEELGYEIELVDFTDYNQPNPALESGELDANWFQHIAFLAEHNIATGDNLRPLAPTETIPLTLYSNEYDDVDEFDEDEIVALPNDPVNQGRAINVLVEAGLVELSEETPQPEPQHVDEAASTVELQPVDAAQTVNALESVEGSLINNNFAQDAELDPLNEGIYSDDPSDPSAVPYVNVFAVTEDQVDNEALQEIAEIYHDDRVLEIMDERSNGTSVPADDLSVEDLDSALADYEEALQGDQ